MKPFTYIQQKHNLVFKLGLILVCSFLIGWMLPGRQVTGHRVDDLTTVWPYADLTAEQDFLVKKTALMLQQEKDELARRNPVFLELSTVERDQKLDQLDRLLKTDATLWAELQPLFDSVYKRGVVESTEKYENRPVYVVSGSYAQPATYVEFFTVRTAAAFIEKQLHSQAARIRYPDFLTITHFVNASRAEQYLQTRLEQVSLYRGSVKAGEVIVRRGEQLTPDKRYLINRYFDERNGPQEFVPLNFFARWALAFCLLLVLLVFLAFFRRLIFGQNRQVVFLFIVVTAAVFTVFLFHRYGLMLLALPFALVPILIRVFFDARTALFTYLMVVVATAFFMADKLEFVYVQLITGIGTLFAVAEIRKRQQVLNAAALVLVFYVLLFVIWQLAFGTKALILRPASYLPFALSSLSVLLAYPMIYLTERFFGFTSDFRLLELCDLNQPLLRKLSQDVPGTFQHSLQVANLAEEAIYHIGGNSLLVRAGAMYHDIGKIENPNFFIENQLNGFNPHQDMDPLDSAKIIIGHVIKGIELAKEYGLPEQIIDFIRTHHGTTSVGYFLRLSQLQHSGSQVAEEDFRYPGPIPFSRETAVLMIADGVEAASRSLKVHDAVSINELVDTIIDYKIGQNQFINSDITFRDITTIKKIFKKRLMNIYHARIEYPS